jgi:hypothetical protein
METESNNAIAFLEVLVIREETTLATKVNRKSTHIRRYLNFNSNHPPHVKRGLIQSLHNRASTICQERQDLVKEIGSLGMIPGSTVIVSIKSRSLWALCIFHM